MWAVMEALCVYRNFCFSVKQIHDGFVSFGQEWIHIFEFGTRKAACGM